LKPNNSELELKKILLSAMILFGLMFYSELIHSQERQTSGIVLDIITRKPICNANVEEIKFGNSISTDSTGHYTFLLPKKSRKLLFTCDEYFDFNKSITTCTARKNLKILLRPLNAAIADTLWAKQKNVISLAPFELINGAIGLRYERFLKRSHSIGLHSSLYLYGYNSWLLDFGSNPVSYKGLKLAPFYRFYMVRSNDHGFFIEGKIPFGYFNFSTLTYICMHEDNFPQNFWTIGGAVGVGWMFRLGHSLHGVGNLSLGYQFFPMDVPAYYIIEEGAPGRFLDYDLNNTWWYASGPGSVIEIKFTMGGIF
jgi:hypothetical protein